VYPPTVCHGEDRKVGEKKKKRREADPYSLTCRSGLYRCQHHKGKKRKKGKGEEKKERRKKGNLLSLQRLVRSFAVPNEHEKGEGGRRERKGGKREKRIKLSRLQNSFLGLRWMQAREREKKKGKGKKVTLFVIAHQVHTIFQR